MHFITKIIVKNGLGLWVFCNWFFLQLSWKPFNKKDIFFFMHSAPLNLIHYKKRLQKANSYILLKIITRTTKKKDEKRDHQKVDNKPEQGER